ncbi:MULTISPECIES: serine/threonine-protein kinase [unclassified Streptomyces]|uniref:serine/threonine-protein kinase n=1 Tax=unclassified Streptomyces TaxID=2593676 RepID=UPI00145E3542|nr:MULTISPECIES: serine/threonine-protein kinase [unclassified Streptomyces]
MHGAKLDGRYRLESVLGAGGMGQVWRAFDERVGRPVAVKLLTGADPVSANVERFAAEARAAGNLSSPHIVTIHDFGRTGPDQGRAPFLVMELIEGQSLEEVISQGAPPPVRDALDWTLQVCTGLATAHRAGLVHRDIKPANAMLLSGGAVKILDFGIAKHLYEDLALTGTGHAIGTAAYMAPEQARGDRNIGPAADLYAVGCLLYTLLTGQPPFTGAPLAVLHQHLTRQPEAPSSLRPSIPATVDEVVLHLLAKEAADRPADAAHVIDAIETLLAAPAQRHHPTSPSAVAPEFSSTPTMTAWRSQPATPHPPTVPDAAPAPAPAPEAAVPARREPAPIDASPEPTAAPAEPQAAGSAAMGRSVLAGSALVGLQLVAFASWSVTWAIPVTIGAALLLALGLKFDELTAEDAGGAGGFSVSMGVTVISCLLLLTISSMPWWGVLILSWVMCPLLWGVQKPLVRRLSKTFTRHPAEVQMAVSVGMVDATLTTGLLVGTQLPVLTAVLLGVLTWMATSAVLTVLLPFRQPVGSRTVRRAAPGASGRTGR